LQTVISRENNPEDPAVITVGSIHGGTKRNVIPDKVEMQLSMRSFDDRVSEKLIKDIRQIADGIAASNGLDAAHAPTVEVGSDQDSVGFNDPALATRVQAAVTAVLGSQNVVQSPPVMASEDFWLYGLPGHQIPAFMFWLGAVDSAKLAASQESGIPLPGPHSPLFAPVPEATLGTAVTAMTAVALDLLGKSQPITPEVTDKL
jgi:hippurate hydrolase